MRTTILRFAVIIISLGLLLSGAQTVAGYYSDPSGYGFHHLEYAYLYISVASLFLACMFAVFILRRA